LKKPAMSVNNACKTMRPYTPGIELGGSIDSMMGKMIFQRYVAKKTKM
jgi:hypothetical protein